MQMQRMEVDTKKGKKCEVLEKWRNALQFYGKAP